MTDEQFEELCRRVDQYKLYSISRTATKSLDKTRSLRGAVVEQCIGIALTDAVKVGKASN